MVKVKENLDSVYNAIIIALVIGIILTLVFLVITFEKPEYFTEIYFEDSENLPEKIKLNQDYNFSFTIHSLENTTKSYDYVTRLDFYNLYDITEGTYKCLTKYRDKLRLEWTFGELIDNKTFSEIKEYLKDRYKSKLIKNTFTRSVENLDMELIEWDSYNIEYNYHTIDGLGQINTVFMDRHGKNKYALVFSESTDDILFVRFKKGRMEITRKAFDFNSGKWYNVRIKMRNNGLQLYINNIFVLDKKNIQTSNLRIGLENKNTYAGVGLMKVYKEDFSLKDTSTIKEFVIDGADMIKEHNKLIDRRIDYLNIKKVEGLEDYSKSAYYATGFRDKGNDYEVRDHQNKTAEVIDWDSYDFEFKYKTIEGDGNIMAYFKDLQERILYALIISEERGERSFLTLVDKGLKVKRKKINISKGEKHYVKITINRNKAAVYIDNNLIAVSEKINNKKGKIGFALKNTDAALLDVSVINNEINGSDPRIYKKYWKKYSIKDIPKIDTEQIAERDFIPVMSKEREKEYEDFIEAYKEESRLIYEYDFLEPSLPADYDKIKELNQSFNPYIKDKKIAFSGPHARISNWSNYTFTFSYVALDGLKEIVNSFQSFDGKDKYSLMIAEKLDKIFFVYHEKIKELSKKVDINEEEWHNVRLDVENKTAKFFFDRELIFDLNDVDFSTGQFVLETRNTYAHFRWVNAYNDKGEKKRYGIEEDPCQLKKIGDQIIEKKGIILNPDEKATINNNFNIDKFFDYAKVSVETGGREIHFWVTRG